MNRKLSLFTGVVGRYLCLTIIVWLSVGATAMAVTQSQRVTISANNVSLLDFLEDVQSQTGLYFIYDHSDFNSQKISVDAKDEPIGTVLRKALADPSINISFEDNTVILKRLQAPAVAREEIAVKGVVKDEKGTPLAGVFVRIKGTGRGTATKPNGSYEIKVSDPKAVLLFSMIGMKPVEETVGKRRTIDVVMREAVNEVGEVVVTGIFTKAKESYTGSVSTVSRETLKSFKGQNLLQTLRNIDASINFPVNNAVGSDPNRLPNIMIRGGSAIPSLSELEGQTRQQVNIPLIIMDGFEISLQKLMDFNDEEIESINILKDAAATSIYGSRGANGVIVIVTRQPEVGDLKIQISGGLNIEVPDLTSYKLLNSREKLSLEKFVGLYADEKSPEKDLALQQYYNQRLKRVLNGTDIDWLQLPVQVGVGQRYTIRLDGGSKAFRWSSSVNYNTIFGVMKGSTRNNFMGDVTLIYNYNNLIFRNSINVGTTKSDASKYGQFYDYAVQQPYNDPYDEYGRLVRNFPNFDHSATVINPLWDSSLNSFDINKSFSFIDNFSVDWLFTKCFRLRGQVGFQYQNRHHDQFFPAEHSSFDKESYKTAEGIYRKGSYLYEPSSRLSVDGRATLSYSRLFAGKHQLYGGLDISLNNTNQQFYSISAEGFSNQNLSLLSNASQYRKNSRPIGGDVSSRRLGFTGNVNYIYDNRLFVDASYRVDGSSDFGANKRWAPFWSVGMGWNVHNETFIRANKYINTLRLRASVGDVGQVNFQRNQVQTTYKYSSNSQYFNWVAAVLSGWGNPDLTWQITHTSNAGFELGLFKNWIAINLEVYTKTTDNLLSKLSLPGASGFPSYTANVGEVGSHGFEFSSNVYIIRDYDKDLRWQIGGQLVYNKTNILRLSDDVKEYQKLLLNYKSTDVSRLFFEGRPVNSLYAVRSLGIDPAYGEEIFLNKDGVITNKPLPSDKVYLGTGEPLYRGLVNTTFYWKGLSVNLSGNFHWGGLQYNSTLQDRVEVSRGTISRSNVDERVMLDRWRKPNDHVFFKNYDDVTGQQTSRFVMKDDVFEISSLSLQYRWASEMIKKRLKLRAINFSVNVNNLGYFSSVKMERGTSYPFSRSVIGSVSIYY